MMTILKAKKKSWRFKSLQMIEIGFTMINVGFLSKKKADRKFYQPFSIYFNAYILA
jgi:hypothetical protein